MLEWRVTFTPTVMSFRILIGFSILGIVACSSSAVRGPDGGGAGGSGGTMGAAGAGGSGASGAGGSAGTTGTAGRGGTAGTSGAAGTTGGAGTSGAAGRGGATGTGGAAGTTGAAGKGGAAGTGGAGGAACCQSSPMDCSLAADAGTNGTLWGCGPTGGGISAQQFTDGGCVARATPQPTYCCPSSFAPQCP
jgi:pilus assembly protein FimV